MASKQPFVVGVLTDTQYADADDGTSFDGTEQRFFRHAETAVVEAVETWRKSSPPVALVFHVGDIVDGRHSKAHSLDGLDRIRKPLESLGVPVVYACGNHELYHWPRDDVASLLGFPDSSLCRRVTESPPGWRLLVLDVYGVSILGTAPGSPERALAEQLLATHNPNADKNSATGLVGIDRRWVAFNGAVAPAALRWLEDELSQARAAGERVILFSHVPLHPECGAPLCTVWNYAEVGAVLAPFVGSTLVLCVHGHDHRGGHTTLVPDQTAGVTATLVPEQPDVSAVCIEAVLLCPEGENAFATLELWDDRIEMHGHGAVADRVFRLRP
eukprot:a843986_32.p1 GENE.a843986_32~~a843986_32.p1  ORF type:complete len:342 (-),score=100.42 a843986_32:187-1173(-)